MLRLVFRLRAAWRRLCQVSRQRAWIAADNGMPVTHCRVSAFSPAGARIELDVAQYLPDTFCLFLAGCDRPSRCCRVIWRRPREIGVRFERPGAIPAVHGGLRLAAMSLPAAA